LSESIDALHRLNTHRTTAAASADRIEYAQKGRNLERYIGQLQSAISRKQDEARSSWHGHNPSTTPDSISHERLRSQKRAPKRP
jgi:hypothetical protein